MKLPIGMIVCATAGLTACVNPASGEQATRKIVLLAGSLDKGHPRGTHEYEKALRYLKHCLDNTPGLEGVLTELHAHGWPEDPSTLDNADTIVLFGSGSDRVLEDHPFLVGDRLEVIDRQMKRGCGLVLLHWCTFAPNGPAGDHFLDWVGGYFDYQSGTDHPNKWYSRIKTEKTTTAIPSRDHPISRGLVPYELLEEYYYRIRFRENDPRLVPILNTPISDEAEPQSVAWAVERADGGRGFGFTGGHFLGNFFVENFRRMILNAILWTAHVEVPAGGVETRESRIRALILTGHNHPAHDWRAVTEALQEALSPDARFEVEVTEDPEFLAKSELHTFDVLVFNYVNWMRPGLSPAAKENFQKHLAEGGGLSVIHFANGAFNYSLPDTPDSDWPEFRKRIVRRVWIHGEGQSAHDPYGKFKVQIAKPDHPITRGMKAFETVDELYYNQIGELPIEPLVTAKSANSGRDEPLAWAYDYEQGRVFQTLLGHAAESVRAPGAADLIRRGTAWAAGRIPMDIPVLPGD
ncbi:MAG: ThuA domain-containing protein [Candidatus Omnitrophica bacterium]|nr:ThuA domain-containing protein [Candidatus Omnitrophota bacterium]